MTEELIVRAVTNTSNVLEPVLNIAYSLKPVDKSEVLRVAIETNKTLGFALFDDLYYPRLVHDFALVARAVANNAIKKPTQ